MTELLAPAELAELGHREGDPLPLELVTNNPNNPRRELVEVDALADNIRSFSTQDQTGLMQPVLVRRKGDNFELLGGHRRLAAFKLLRDQEPFEPKWRAIPAVVWSADDERAELALISGQAHVVSWKPREEAAALERLILAGRSVKQVGEALSKTESWASKRLRIYVDSILSGFVQAGTIPTSVAEELLVIKDIETKRKLAQRAADEGWSQDRARGETRALRLDRQLAEVARRAHELLELLAVVQIGQLPIESLKELNLLSIRIRKMAKGDAPILPSIEAAERAAGVNPNASPRRRPGRPRQRTMPRPA